MIPLVTLQHHLRSQGKFTEAEQIRVRPQRTTADVNTGSGCHFWNLRCNPCNTGTQGYGINLNMHPQHQRGIDGVLAFDTNRDGRYDKGDIQRTNDLMKAAGNNFDFNRDGLTDRFEWFRGRRLQHVYSRLDHNRDGKLSGFEVQAAGGKIWVDRSRDGFVNENELSSPLHIAQGTGIQRLDYIDPMRGFSRTTPMAVRRSWNIQYPGP